MDAATELAHIRQENEKLRGRKCRPRAAAGVARRQLRRPQAAARVVPPPALRQQVGEADRDPARADDFLGPAGTGGSRRSPKSRNSKPSSAGSAGRSASRGRSTNPGFGSDRTFPWRRSPSTTPRAAAIPESERELVGEKVVHKLAQITCDYRILRYVARSWKRRDTGEFIAAAPPPAVLDRTCADVSFLAGMMVDKFCWHLPLHRQHQRLEAAGNPGEPLEPDELDAEVRVAAGAGLRRPVQVDPGKQGDRDGRDPDPGRADRAGEDAHRLVLAGLRRPRRDRLPVQAVAGERRRPRPARRLQGDAGLGRQPGLRRLRGIPKRRGHARFLLGRTPGASSRRRRIPSRGSAPRRWS